MTHAETTALLSESYAIQVQLLNELDTATMRYNQLMRYIGTLHRRIDDHAQQPALNGCGCKACAR